MDIHEEDGKGLMGGKRNAYNENPEAFTVYSQQRNAGVQDAIVSNQISINGLSSSILHNSVIKQSVHQGFSVMEGSKGGSVMSDARDKAGSSKVLIMTVLCAIAFGANTAYSVVAPILPNVVKSYGLVDLYTAIIISGYPLGMILFTPSFGKMLNTIGQKKTLLIGVISMGISMLVFGFLDYFPKPAGQWWFFVVSVLCRILMGFGNGCLNSATSSIIAFNYPESMGFLIGLQQIFNNAGMLIGTLLGGVLFSWGGFMLPFALNAGVLLLLGVVTCFTFPQDHPLGSLPGADEFKTANKGKVIGICDLMKDLKVAGVAFSMISTLFSFTFKESIAEPEFTEYYFFPVADVGYLLMSEGVMFILGSVILTMIPDSKKNYNFIVMLGTIGFSICMVLEGPFWGINVSRVSGWQMVMGGIAIGGFSGAMIMPAAVPAISNILDGVYVGEQEDQMKNAMSSLVAGAFGLGNLTGTMSGGILATILKPPGCVVYITAFGAIPNYKLKNGKPINPQLDASTENYQKYWEMMDENQASTAEYDKLYIPIDATNPASGQVLIANYHVQRIHENGQDKGHYSYFYHFDDKHVEPVHKGSIPSTADVIKAGEKDITQYCMMMTDINADTKQLEQSVVAIPNVDTNWKTSVSIGGCVCMVLCAVQVVAFCKPTTYRSSRRNDENGTEMKQN